MLDAQTDRADYVSPNGEKLLGITAEQIQEDVHVLGKLHPKEFRRADDELFSQGLRSTSSVNGTLNISTRRPASTAGSRYRHGQQWRAERKYILVMSDRTADKKINQALSEAVARRGDRQPGQEYVPLQYVP